MPTLKLMSSYSPVDLGGLMDGSDVDGVYDPAADFAQIGPDGSVYVDIDVDNIDIDIDPFEAAF